MGEPCTVSLARQRSFLARCDSHSFGCERNGSTSAVWVSGGCRGDFLCDGVLVSCGFVTRTSPEQRCGCSAPPFPRRAEVAETRRGTLRRGRLRSKLPPPSTAAAWMRARADRRSELLADGAAKRSAWGGESAVGEPVGSRPNVLVFRHLEKTGGTTLRLAFEAHEKVQPSFGFYGYTGHADIKCLPSWRREGCTAKGRSGEPWRVVADLRSRPPPPFGGAFVEFHIGSHLRAWQQTIDLIEADARFRASVLLALTLREPVALYASWWLYYGPGICHDFRAPNPGKHTRECASAAEFATRNPNLQTWLLAKGVLPGSNKTDLEKAEELLRRVDLVGVTEALPAFMRELCGRMRLGCPRGPNKKSGAMPPHCVDPGHTHKSAWFRREFAEKRNRSGFSDGKTWTAEGDAAFRAAVRDAAPHDTMLYARYRERWLGPSAAAAAAAPAPATCNRRELRQHTHQWVAVTGARAALKECAVVGVDKGRACRWALCRRVDRNASCPAATCANGGARCRGGGWPTAR